MGLFSIFNVAGSGMAAESLRLNTTASNLANANSVSSTPQGAYRAREPVFAAVQEAALAEPKNPAALVPTSFADPNAQSTTGVRVVGTAESSAPIHARYEPGNPMADASGYVYGSNVSPIDELVNMISASRSYQQDVEVVTSAKQLMLETLNLGNQP